MPFTRVATEEDVHALSPRLRLEDEREARASGSPSGHQALLYGIKHSQECRALCFDTGLVIGLYGITPGQHGSGCIWMMASPELPVIKVFFMQETHRYLTAQKKLYRSLCGLVDSRNTLHTKWLKRVGFSFVNIVNHNSVIFYEFFLLGDPSCVTH